jgi:hypothetical protein
MDNEPCADHQHDQEWPGHRHDARRSAQQREESPADPIAERAACRRMEEVLKHLPQDEQDQHEPDDQQDPVEHLHSRTLRRGRIEGIFRATDVHDGRASTKKIASQPCAPRYRLNRRTIAPETFSPAVAHTAATPLPGVFTRGGPD